MKSFFGEIVVGHDENVYFNREEDTPFFLRYLTLIVLKDIDDLRLVSYHKKLNDIDWFSEEIYELSQFAEKYNSIFLVSDKMDRSSVELKFGEYTDGFLRIKESAMSKNNEMLNRISNYDGVWGVFTMRYEEYRLF